MTLIFPAHLPITSRTPRLHPTPSLCRRGTSLYVSRSWLRPGYIHKFQLRRNCISHTSLYEQEGWWRGDVGATTRKQTDGRGGSAPNFRKAPTFFNLQALEIPSGRWAPAAPRRIPSTLTVRPHNTHLYLFASTSPLLLLKPYATDGTLYTVPIFFELGGSNEIIMPPVGGGPDGVESLRVALTWARLMEQGA